MELRKPVEVELPDGVEVRPASQKDHRVVFEGNAEVFSGSQLGYIQDTFEGFEKDVADEFPEHTLWTIAENPTGSVARYEKLGYRITVRLPRYRKPL